MKAQWYVIIVVLILGFIYFSSSGGTVTVPNLPNVTAADGIDVESYARLNWSSMTLAHSDAVTGRLEAIVYNTSQTKKYIGRIAQGMFLGKVYYDGRMRQVAATVSSGSFTGEFVGDLAGATFKGNVTGKANGWMMAGYMEPLAATVATTPPTTQNNNWIYWVVGAGAVIAMYSYGNKKIMSRYMDDAAIDKRLRKFINDNYSKQVWKVLKHKSVPEDAPQWVKIHFMVSEPFGTDCLTIFRIKDGRFTDTAFGVMPYEIEDFWERRISYESGFSSAPTFRGPGRPPKNE